MTPNTPDKPKSTVEEIRARFDNDVERFSNLETGHAATIDALDMLDLLPRAAAALNPGATSILDIGSGAGNYTIKTCQHLPDIKHVTLVDLSQPMLDRARHRLSQVGVKNIDTVQQDIREARFNDGAFDIVLAAAVLHHLRSREEWLGVLNSIHGWLRPGGVLAVFDLISHETPAVQELMQDRYGSYLAKIGGQAYKAKVLAYIEQEDTPWPLSDQLGMLAETGFRQIEILHKNGPFCGYTCVK